MPMVVVEISDGDLVDEVYDEEGNGIGYLVVDHTMWEGGGCAFCHGENLERLNIYRHYASRFDQIIGRAQYEYGGYMRCKDCGCTEDTDVSTWIKKGGLKE